jgi:lipoprotein-anchoring transpeptidase ErfK/SrfK
VRLLMRPNNSTGWVRTAELRTYEVANRVVIERAARRLTVYRGDSDEVLFATDAGVGAGRTPTPLGEFWIDIVYPLDGTGVYGWGQLSVSGFSEVLMTFGGGIGQIAIHGTNNPSSVGDDVSNGCIRLRNDDIARVAELTSVGTPVTIVE